MSDTETTPAQAEPAPSDQPASTSAASDTNEAKRSKRDTEPAPSFEPDPQESGDDKGAPDWKSEARKHESRAKASKAAADKAAADKAASDAAREAAEKSQRELMDNLAKALGFKKDDAPPDPEALQRAVSERDARLTDVQAEKDREVAARDDTIRQQRVELAAWRLGSDPKLGANVAALLDSRRVAESISGLDPAGDSFEKDITAVIKAALESNPAYRINQAAPAADAGIGATGAKNSDAHVTPGVGRLRAGYGAA